MDTGKKSKIKINSKDIAIYKSKMVEIKFLAEDVNDISEIFGGDPMKCKMFLIKVFTALDSNLYYLSFLSNDAIDHELLKAASLLQLHSVDSKKTSELFQNMNKKDTHNFWMRLFKLCKMHDTELESNSTCAYNVDSMTFNSRFCNLKEALEYCNYGISLINPTKLDENIIDEEINSWNGVLLPPEPSKEGGFYDESHIEVQENIPDISNLMKNINYIEKKIDVTSATQNHTQVNKYTDFFVKFNEAVKEISNFESNMNFISSVSIQNVLNASVCSGFKLTVYNNQIKRCNDLIKSIKEKKECQLSS